MKITKSFLKNLIKEELEKMSEQEDNGYYPITLRQGNPFGVKVNGEGMFKIADNSQFSPGTYAIYGAPSDPSYDAGMLLAKNVKADAVKKGIQDQTIFIKPDVLQKLNIR